MKVTTQDFGTVIGVAMVNAMFSALAGLMIRPLLLELGYRVSWAALACFVMGAWYAKLVFTERAKAVSSAR
jgi:hypothetical protein